LIRKWYYNRAGTVGVGRWLAVTAFWRKFPVGRVASRPELGTQ